LTETEPTARSHRSLSGLVARMERDGFLSDTELRRMHPIGQLLSDEKVDPNPAGLLI